MKIVVTLMAFALVGLMSSVGSAQELSEQDKVHIAVQEICPMTGQKLGAHGTPVKVKLGEEEVFLCCKACLEQKVDPKHWATIHANFAKAQGICPIMKKELPEKAKWTIVKGHIFYVCCPPCTDKIAADPETYVEQLTSLYRKSLEARGIRIE